MITYQGAIAHSWTGMGNCLNLHVNGVIVIVYAYTNQDISKLDHDQCCDKTTSRDPFTPSPIEQTP